MTKSSNPWKHVPCRYYLVGQCNRGDSCPYAHDTDRPVHVKEEGPPICAYFLAGHCTYGDTCRFRHLTKKEVKEEEERKSGSSKPATKPERHVPAWDKKVNAHSIK